MSDSRFSEEGMENVSLGQLRARLREVEETLDAIRNGDVDAVVVNGPSGQQVYTLDNADRPYRVLIEQMHEGAVTLAADGTILYCNERFATLAGVRRELIIGETVERFFGRSESFDGLFRRDLREGTSEEFVLSSQSGGKVPVNLSLVELEVAESAPRVICGVVTDLTHNRRRSHELAATNIQLAGEIDERKRAEASLQLALDAAGMGSWDIDLTNGMVRRSLRHDQIFGHEVAVPVWRLEQTLQHFLPEDRPAVASTFAAALVSGAIEFEARISRAGDGATRWLQIKGQAYYEDDQPIRIAGVVVDVTDQRLVEEQLRQAQKMEAVGQLTGGIAHDFNNLLQVISGQLQLLRKDVTGNERAEGHVQNAMEGTVRGARLASQLLAFGRRQPLAPKVVNIGRFIRQIVSLLRRAAGDGVEIEMVMGEGLWNTSIDPANLENALLNMTINARDAMDAHGLLTLSIQNVVLNEASTVERGEATPGEYVSLSVADTGCGISPAIIQKVFEPFFTTKAEGKGTGLGLSMVYGFVKQSGGHVDIESEPGAGTIVRLLLPRCRLPEDMLVETEPRAVVGGNETVLVAEDDPAVRETVVAMLQDLGYTVLTARDGQSALTILESGVAVDLLFTDVVMPGVVKSTKLAEKAREHRPGLAILFTSGYAADAIVHKGRLDADTELLSKPYTREALARKVREMLARRPVAVGIPGDRASQLSAASEDQAALRILVCEDNEIIRLNTIDMLEELGHAAIGTADARQALKAFATEKIDVLLTDVGLPDMTGVELARQIRGKRAGLPVIFATGYGQVVGIAEWSPVALLAKPFTLESLADTVDSVTAGAV